MKEVLTGYLFTTWPRIFAASGSDLAILPLEQRITCGDGWFPIIAALCEALQWETDHEAAPQIVVAQIKTKLGSMHLAAFGPRSERQAGMIQLVHMLSARIAEGPASLPDEAEIAEKLPWCACVSAGGGLLRHGADTIVRIARAGGGPVVVGESLGTDAIVRIIKSTRAPIVVKARNRPGDALVRIARAGGSRITIDFS
ncbi:MAG: hypothetical protein ACREP4_12440 [Stenotrophomonas sp.]|uniref:hypothetical protein n=1 Tax=Stenotrophomonas sp. TaxID=69392 RepID=UPI003D6D83D2